MCVLLAEQPVGGSPVAQRRCTRAVDWSRLCPAPQGTEQACSAVHQCSRAKRGFLDPCCCGAEAFPRQRSCLTAIRPGCCSSRYAYAPFQCVTAGRMRGAGVGFCCGSDGNVEEKCEMMSVRPPQRCRAKAVLSPIPASRIEDATPHPPCYHPSV